MRWTAAAMFPPRVRQMYGLRWSAARERRFRGTMRVVAAVDRAVPGTLRMRAVRLTVEHDLPPIAAPRASALPRPEPVRLRARPRLTPEVPIADRRGRYGDDPA